MEATQANPSHIATPHTHPLLLAAAASVTVLSLAGVGVLAGWLPGPGAHGAEIAKLTAPPAPAPISIQQAVSVPQEKFKPAATSRERTHASASRAVTAPAPVGPATVSPAPTYSAASPTPTYGVSSQEPVYRVAAPTPAICYECGVVETVREMAVEAKGSGGGAIAGGVVGGMIANQIGKGATRDIATVLGAVGGAYAGNHIEKTVKEAKRYDVIVRFEDGSTRTFSSDTPPAWQSGDRVRLQSGGLVAGNNRSGGSSGVI
jgi:outer membrane lipoprotein SlyB